MGTMVVTGMLSGSPSSARKKAQRALRGRRRKAVQKLLHYIKVVNGQDTNEEDRSAMLNYAPFLFKVRRGNAVDKALDTLLARCNAALGATLS